MAVLDLEREVLDWRFKAIPVTAWGRTVGAYAASRPRLAELGAPMLTLDARALDRNIAAMAAYCDEAGVAHAPHGKTTMAPALWARQLAAGAWGVTVANVPQLRVARAFETHRVQLANTLTDLDALRWISAELDRRPELEFVSWLDSLHALEIQARALRECGAQRPLDVFVELGVPGGRTGVRTVEQAYEIARAVGASPAHRLVGVAGYEGVLAHDAEPASREAVRAYLADLADLHRRIGDAGLYDGLDVVYLTAGGSSYFDDVVDVLQPFATGQVKVMLRAGAYIIHDDGFYRGTSPFSRGVGRPLTSAMHGWARVLSRPEPGLAILDGGKRDFSFDEGLPVPQNVGGRISAIADQHMFLQISGETPPAPGEIVRLGLSHPCTVLDKWSLIPVVENADDPDPVVVDFVRTFF